MKNQIALGHTLNVPLPADTEAGAGVLVGKCFSVAINSGLTGDIVPCSAVGVYKLPKAAVAVSGFGIKLYWDNTAKKVTTVDTNNHPIGHAIEAAESGDAEVSIKLVPTV